MPEKLMSKIKGTNHLPQNETSKFKELYFNAPLPYQSLNDDGTFKEVNFAWCKTLGYTRDEVIGKSFRDFLYPESQPVFDENFPLFKKRGYVNGVQFKIRHKNTSYLQIIFDGCIGYDNNGEFVQTYCIFKNITENKILEDKIAKKQYYLKKAQEIGKIGTWEFNLKNKSLIWTEENYKIFGISMDSEISYDVFLNCVYPPDKEYVNEQWQQALNNSQYDIEHRILANDKIKWVREKADIAYDENGIPISAIGFTQDITDRKEAEAELRKFKSELEEQVEIKTRELKIKVEELERFQKATIDREFRMKELRDEIEYLKSNKT